MTNKLIVGIDGRPLIGPRTGIGQYTAHLIDAISRVDNTIDQHIFTGSSWLNYIPEPDINKKRHITLRAISRFINVFGGYSGLLRTKFNLKVQKTYFNRGLKNIKPQILHGTNFHFYNSDAPTIVTIHDISCFRHPETHPESRVRWQNEILPGTIEHASGILCVSEFTKNEITDYFGIDERRITVTYNGVDDYFNSNIGDEDSSVIESYSLDNCSYALCVGTLEPRKNLKTVILAYSKLPEKVRNNLSLVLVGLKGWKESSLFRLIDKYREKGQIKILGYIPQERLPIIYRNSKMFLYPSIYEGFGMPPLEAMACGTPVITSNVSSLPEVVGDAGILLDPYNIDAWSDAISELFEDKILSGTYISRGINQSRKFTWESCAEKTLSSYRQVV